MIPMSCPNCGRKGNIPLDRLNTRMHCKKCDAVFHLDASGKPVLGEPPAAKGSKAARAAARAKNEPLDPIGIIAAKLVQTPKPVWMTLAILLGCYMLWIVWGFVGPRGATANENFSAQNDTAALAFLNQDVETLKAMSTQDSRDEIAKVVESFRSQVGDKTGKGSEDMQPMAKLPEEMGDEPVVEVSIQPPKPSSEEDAPPMFYLDLIWVKGKNKYYLNGKATLTSNLERERARKETAAINAAKLKK